MIKLLLTSFLIICDSGVQAQLVVEYGQCGGKTVYV
jgi:hypothetical protein